MPFFKFGKDQDTEEYGTKNIYFLEALEYIQIYLSSFFKTGIILWVLLDHVQSPPGHCSLDPPQASHLPAGGTTPSVTAEVHQGLVSPEAHAYKIRYKLKVNTWNEKSQKFNKMFSLCKFHKIPGPDSTLLGPPQPQKLH